MAWSKKAFPNNRKEIDRIFLQIGKVKDEYFNEESRIMVQHLTNELEQLWKLEETYWWQHSKVNWISGGDLNTRFFHTSTLTRRQQNQVVKLKDDSRSQPSLSFLFVKRDGNTAADWMVASSLKGVISSGWLLHAPLPLINIMQRDSLAHGEEVQQFVHNQDKEGIG
ncbi:uncharacterized protein LOC129321271 isoform X1 [Prosopis cineraria]|uniref:uncharacterized protein LOC129321271 isoform X1 n=1 Tax=Prosopis cineraria TaxID=364024 RepID=UPI00241037EC|nr:uncharacterized protein LOC129321271 isoform X1 [Prosopis cineraria]